MKPLLVFVLMALMVVANAENLYRPDEYRPLTADRRARRVGDILTIMVIENSSASATAGTTSDKSVDTSIKLTSPNRQKYYGIGIDDSFDGSGKIARSGRLLAQLSVVVIAVGANGDLTVKGEQILELNGEKQTINLEGRVRPTDIGENNLVPSNRLADAKITYVGDGVLADNQTKGWLTRLITTFLRLI